MHPSHIAMHNQLLQTPILKQHGPGVLCVAAPIPSSSSSHWWPPQIALGEGTFFSAAQPGQTPQLKLQAACATQPQTVQSQAPQCSTQCTGLGDLSSHLRVRPALLKRDAPARKSIFNSGFGLWALALKVELLQWAEPLDSGRGMMVITSL